MTVRLRRACLFFLALSSGCASVEPTASLSISSSGCPTLPSLNGRARRAERACVPRTPTPGVDRVPLGRHIDGALALVNVLYHGGDGLPLDGMLAGALREIATVHERLRLSDAGPGRYVIGAGTRGVTVGPVPDVARLTLELVRVAELAREVLGPEAAAPAVSSDADDGAVEHVLIRGALASLDWETEFRAQPPAEAPLTLASSRVRIDGHGIAYVDVADPSAGATRELRGALLGASGLRGVILDLRASSGGLLDENIGLIDLFTRRGCLATARLDDAPPAKRVRDTSADGAVPLVVLVGNKTADGAELVAASLRAAGRALVVGAKRATHDGLRPLLRLDEHTVMQVALSELLASDGTPFGAGVDPDLTVPSDFSVEGDGDRELAFATQLLLHAKGNRRSDLLTASAPH